MKTLIKNATIVNEGQKFIGSVLISDDIIEAVYTSNELPANADKIIDANGLILMPGVIDSHVHFREPGMAHKADINSETRAALAGGVTSFMDMPNNNPPTVTIELLEKKYETASKNSFINYSFYIGATNENFSEIKQINPRNVCGVKVFLGSSTGNMLVNNDDILEKIFTESPALIAAHCEDEDIICENILYHKSKFGDNISFEYHSKIRSREACIKSTARAIEFAKKHNSRLHILHISTAEEIELLALLDKSKITAETCVHYLWFCDDDYEKMQGKVKCNPSIKSKNDRATLINAVNDRTLDLVSTDHAPHTEQEKNNNYWNCPSGLPLVQHSLNVMLELVRENKITLENLVERMCHAPARIFNIEKRGFIKTGYKADIVLVDLSKSFTVSKSNILYKCAWSPFEGTTFHSQITHTFVNGNLAYHNGNINESVRGERLIFER